MDQRCLLDASGAKKCKHAHLGDAETPVLGRFDKRLPCCGCGIGWCCFLLGFVCPLTWYYASILYFAKYYQKDPRERTGLCASVVAVSFCMYDHCDDHNSHCTVRLELFSQIDQACPRLCTFSESCNCLLTWAQMEGSIIESQN
ncbi:hypothetical protein ACFE04_003788 [Oxalis oulophora]